MMAVMPFKHNNLRLLGLSNKILLADEIHACDAYMSCILEGLIERQARGGNSVILLSATLSVFPAPAGINRNGGIFPPAPVRVPRASGDKPAQYGAVFPEVNRAHWMR